MQAAEILRWTIVSGFAAALLRLPRPAAFWSLGAGRPFVLVHATVGPGRFRQSAPS